MESPHWNSVLSPHACHRNNDRCSFYTLFLVKQHKQRDTKFKTQLSNNMKGVTCIALEFIYSMCYSLHECLTFCSELVIYAVLLRGRFVMNFRILGVKYSGLTTRECKENDKYRVWSGSTASMKPWMCTLADLTIVAPTGTLSSLSNTI